MILVDWSCLCQCTRLYVLRASLHLRGRAMVIYEQVTYQTQQNHHGTHQAFLQTLKRLLPSGCRPIIVTDAGFRAPWFLAVLACGWDYVGRVRHKTQCTDKVSGQCALTHTYYAQASNSRRILGDFLLTERHELPTRFVLYRGRAKQRQHTTLGGQRARSEHSKRYARAHREPWLLATSLGDATARQVVNLYGTRMEIEAQFRDTKCPRYGFGLAHSRTRTPARMQVLLLIAAIASFACWLCGLYVTRQGRAGDYQAQSTGRRVTLSVVYLGRMALRRGESVPWRHRQSLFDYWRQLIYQAHQLCFS